MMTMKDVVRSGWRHAAIAVLLVALLASAAPADMSYSGSLSTANGGLTGFGGWATDAILSWTVDDTTTPGYWHYWYTLNVASKDISHMIIEVSETFTEANLFNLNSTPENWAQLDKVGLNPVGKGNEGLPEAIYGIKINSGSDSTSVTVSFDSNRVPVWGDFYAKDGQASGDWTYLYNSGFLANDPTAPAANGSLDGHLLVPDTYVVPAPGALVLGSIGLAFSGWLRRRKMTS